jgi:hypothetical protein
MQKIRNVLMRRLIALVFALQASFVWAQADVPLFRDLRYDAPIAQFGKAQGYYDCSKAVGFLARCVDNVKFLGLTFDTQILQFLDNRLRTVTIATEMKPQVYTTLIKAIMENFSLLLMQSDGKRLDMLQLGKTEGLSAQRAKVAEFESAGLERGDLTYMFLERPMTELRLYRNGVEAIVESPATAREVDIKVLEKGGESFISASFSLPRRSMAEMRQTPVPKEKF